MTTDQKLDRIIELMEEGLAAKRSGPFTDFADVPVVCTVQDAARVLNRSTSWLYRKLEAGDYVPGVMPRDDHEEWRFSKKALQNYIEGGYLNARRSRR